MEPEIYTILPDGRLYHSYMVDAHVLSPSKQAVTVSPQKKEVPFVQSQMQFSPQKGVIQGSPQRMSPVKQNQTQMNAIHLQQVPNSMYLFPQNQQQSTTIQQNITSSNTKYMHSNRNYVQNLVNEIQTGKTHFDPIDVKSGTNTMTSIELDNNLKNRFIQEMDSIIDSYKPTLSSQSVTTNVNEYESSYTQIHKESDASYISKPNTFTTSHSPNRQSVVSRQFPEEPLIDCLLAAVNGYNDSYKHLTTNEIVNFSKSLIVTKAGVDNIEIRDQNGRLVYGGGFMNGTLNGFGVIFNPFKVFKMPNFKNFNTISKAWDSYEGYFKDGRFHGKGTLILNGEKIIGDFNNGTLNSKAIVESQNGARFIGVWKNNILEE